MYEMWIKDKEGGYYFADIVDTDKEARTYFNELKEQFSDLLYYDLQEHRIANNCDQY